VRKISLNKRFDIKSLDLLTVRVTVDFSLVKLSHILFKMEQNIKKSFKKKIFNSLGILIPKLKQEGPEGPGTLT